ncbi:hypothetical protein C8J56DRAFT_883139 [Mycena floridula]|nr:hypothetical protein C8J56DRAFT_883139 [Mycena floridula]
MNQPEASLKEDANDIILVERNNIVRGCCEYKSERMHTEPVWCISLRYRTNWTFKVPKTSSSPDRRARPKPEFDGAIWRKLTGWIQAVSTKCNPKQGPQQAGGPGINIGTPSELNRPIACPENHETRRAAIPATG